MNAGGHTQGPLVWAWAGHALEGASGDLHVVVPFPGGALVALLDGLGHGPEAALASRAAESVLRAHAAEEVLALVRRCHEALRRTRGVAMSLASFDTARSRLTWTGVGNVDAVLFRHEATAEHRHEALCLRGGVVGYQLPPLRSSVVPLARGDMLVMATDGIKGGFSSAAHLDGPPQEVAESLVARFSKGSDDAHVVVARYLGSS